jgi:hypothetical protein
MSIVDRDFRYVVVCDAAQKINDPSRKEHIVKGGLCE